jgi:hypothetical protein
LIAPETLHVPGQPAGHFGHRESAPRLRFLRFGRLRRSGFPSPGAVSVGAESRVGSVGSEPKGCVMRKLSGVRGARSQGRAPGVTGHGPPAGGRGWTGRRIGFGRIRVLRPQDVHAASRLGSELRRRLGCLEHLQREQRTRRGEIRLHWGRHDCPRGTGVVDDHPKALRHCSTL